MTKILALGRIRIDILSSDNPEKPTPSSALKRVVEGGRFG
jgi:hypothetical protein